MFTLTVDNQSGYCGKDCPFLDIQCPESIFESKAFCLLFKTQLEPRDKSSLQPYYSTGACDKVCERTEMIEKQSESVL